MTKSTILTLSLAIITILLTAYIIYNETTKPKEAYIELQKVFSEFKMAKEMTTEMDKIQSIQASKLDSLGITIEILKRRYTERASSQLGDTIKAKEYEYYLKKQGYEDDIMRVSGDYNDKIWKQLNQYIKDFGRENNYDYLHGASGNGSLMYADSSHNVTGSVIQYINEHYDGKK